MLRNLLIWGLLLSVAYAQDMGYTADSGWTYRHFHARNSPARNSCHRIVQDRDGFFWIATQDGLLQFDGRTLVAHPTSNTPDFYASRVSGIWAISPDSLLVAGHYGNNSSCLIVQGQVAPDRDHVVRKKHLINHFGQFFQTANQTINNELKSGNFIADLSSSPHLYVQQGGLGFHVYASPSDPSPTFVPYEGAYNAMKRCFPVQDGVCFVRDEAPWRAAYFRGTTRQEDQPIRFDIPPPAGDSLHWVRWSENNKHIILGFSHALYVLNQTEKGFFAERLCYGLDFDAIAATWYSPEDGLLLAGSFHSGLYMIKRTPFRLLSSPGGIDAVFYNVLNLGNGKLAALSHQGWHLWSHIGGPRTDIPVQGEVASPRMCHQDAQGNLWTSIYDPGTRSLRLMRFTPGRWSAPLSIVELGSDAHFLAGMPNGPIWLVGQHDITRIDPVSLKVDVLENSPPWREKTLLGSACAPNGVLWVGTEQGVFQWDPVTHRFDSLPEMRGVSVRNFYFEPDGNCWVASYGQGFFHVSGSQITPIPGDEAGYLRFTHAFVSDSRGFCWITTNDGLFCTPRKALIDYIAGRGAPPEYCYFNLAGLPSSEFNGGASQPLLILPDGQVVSCNLAGLVAFSPAQIPVSFPKRPVNLQSARLGESDLRLLPNTTLEPDFGRITFVLGTAYSGPVENAKIYFRLAGYDTEWRIAKLGEPITYTALPAGNYSLETRILRQFGGKYEYQTLLKFKVNARWYQTWWARSFFIISLLLISYGISRWRVNRVKWLNLELNRLVSERTVELEKTVEQLHLSEASLRMAMETRDRIISIISHDMKTPLLFMARVSNDLLRSPIRLSEKEMREYLRQVATTTAEMHQWLNTLLSWMRSEANLSLQREDVSLGELSREIVRIFQQAAETKGINLISEIPENCIISGDRNWLKVMLGNLIENSIKFSSKGCIKIETELLDNEKLIKISDAGRGMTDQRVIAMQKEQIAVAAKGTAGERGLGLGLQIVAKVVALHHGRWQIESAPDKGTTVYIWLPYQVNP